ncbi:TetR/AcrR family transcriptional regulator, partial [Streptomyces sp. YC419]|nr:TetR/AcrR family transcriptional regulator [Streptomyces ureilyticus]
PNLAQVAPYLAEIDEEDQFETAIGLFLDAVELRAQRARAARAARAEGSEHTEN